MLTPDQRLLAILEGGEPGGTSAARDTWDGQPALAPDGRTIVDGSAFGRTAVGLWELPAAAG